MWFGVLSGISEFARVDLGSSSDIGDHTFALECKIVVTDVGGETGFLLVHDDSGGLVAII
jgi:hypothetical protein